MKALFKDMDFFKGVILAMVALSLGLGGFAWYLTIRLRKCRKALDATEYVIPELAALEKQIRELKASERKYQGEVRDDSMRVYLDSILTTYAQIQDRQSFTITEGKKSELTGTMKGFEEQIATIEFNKNRSAKDRKPMPRSTIWYILFNAEAVAAPKYKLRSLEMRAAEEVDGGSPGGRKHYPETLTDNWYVDKLEFAVRMPKTK
jgi:hypothetical protein